MDEKNLSREEVADLLRRYGITLTHQRLEIAHVLLARNQHLSADQVLDAANRRHAETSKATVYNTLKLFLGKGLVREVIVDPARVFYDSDTSAHYHLYDSETGELVDIPATAIQISGLPDLPGNRVAERVDIIIRAHRAD